MAAAASPRFSPHRFLRQGLERLESGDDELGKCFSANDYRIFVPAIAKLVGGGNLCGAPGDAGVADYNRGVGVVEKLGDDLRGTPQIGPLGLERVVLEQIHIPLGGGKDEDDIVTVGGDVGLLNGLVGGEDGGLLHLGVSSNAEIRKGTERVVEPILIEKRDEAGLWQSESVLIVLQTTLTAHDGLEIAETGHGKRGYDAVSNAVNHTLTNKIHLF